LENYVTYDVQSSMTAKGEKYYQIISSLISEMSLSQWCGESKNKLERM